MKRKILLLCFIAFYGTIIHAQTDWHINGNGGTTDSNFIGTTDAKAFRFKVNNEKAGYLEYEYNKANTSFGYQTLNVNTGNYNDAFGYKALFANTTGGYNTATGHAALYNNTTGNFNTSAGTSSMLYNTTGSYNTAVGGWVLFDNTTGGYNTSVGMNSLFENTAGSWNVASGVNALNQNKSGNYNSAFGSNAIYLNTTGNNNTAAGHQALNRNTTGSYNTAVGDSALNANTTGNYNTAIGKLAGPTKPTFINTTAVGYKASPTANNQVRIGNASVISIGGQVNWTVFSDERVKNNIKENVPGLSFIKALRPVTYQYNIAKENELLGLKNEDNKEAGNSDIEKINFTGLIAQEVDKAAQKIGYDFSGIDKTGAIMGLRYTDFIVPVVKAVQELDAANTEKDAKIASLQQQIDELKTLVQSLAKNNGSITANAITLSSASLEQNMPNPFTSSTVIRYKVPASVTSAQIMVTNTTGNTVKAFTLSNKGAGSVTINANELSAGSYFYTLIIDGKKADSKQMILVK